MTGVGTRWKHFIYDRVTSFHSVVANETNRLIVGYGLWMTTYEFCSDIAGSNHREHVKPFVEGFPRNISCFECENRKAEKILHQPNDFYLIRTRNRLKP